MILRKDAYVIHNEILEILSMTLTANLLFCQSKEKLDFLSSFLVCYLDISSNFSKE